MISAGVSSLGSVGHGPAGAAAVMSMSMRGSDVSASGRAVSGAASTSVDRSLDYAGLAEAARALAARISDATRVALWATPTTETAVAAVAALLAGVPVIPVNPNRGTRELAHIVADSDPSEA